MSSDQSTASRRQRDDSEDEGPPRQRPRLDDETLVGDDPLIVRHPAFYRPDGDCVLRLENTLFKVHRHLLNVESSAFEGMFALPCGAENKFEGEDDEHPITLFGDTVDQLESFFHYAYLSPLHLQYRRVPTVDIQRLINTAQFCHKYRLLYFEKWAREAIATVCTRRADGLLKTCTPELYVALLELDLLSPQPAVKDLIRSRWIRRLKDDPTMSLVAALDAADKLQSRALLGDLYYLQLQRIDETQAHVLGADAAPPLPAELSDVHKLRLLTGFRSLTLAWTRVAANPIVVGLCFVSHDHDHWEHEWKAAALEAPATGSDLTRKLQTLQKSLAARFAAFEQAGDPPCLAIRNALRKLPGLLKLSQATIPDHFLGPLPEASFYVIKSMFARDSAPVQAVNPKCVARNLNETDDLPRLCLSTRLRWICIHHGGPCSNDAEHVTKPQKVAFKFINNDRPQVGSRTETKGLGRIYHSGRSFRFSSWFNSGYGLGASFIPVGMAHSVVSVAAVLAPHRAPFS